MKSHFDGTFSFYPDSLLLRVPFDEAAYDDLDATIRSQKFPKDLPLREKQFIGYLQHERDHAARYVSTSFGHLNRFLDWQLTDRFRKLLKERAASMEDPAKLCPLIKIQSDGNLCC